MSTDRHWDGKPFCGCFEPHILNAAATLPKWPGNYVSWALAGDWSASGLPTGVVEGVFAAAFAAWEAVCGIQAEKVPPARAMALLELRAIDGPGKVLAWSELADNTVRQKRQRYDAGEQWNRTVKLLNVATHEVGHLIGIEHLADGNLMQRLYDHDLATPQAGDVEAAVRRYGPPKAKPVPAPTPAPTPAAALITLPADVVIAAVRAAGYTVERGG